MLAGRRSHRARRSRPSALTGGTSAPAGLHTCPEFAGARPRILAERAPPPPAIAPATPPQPRTKHHRCVTARRVNPKDPARPAAAARRVTPQDTEPGRPLPDDRPRPGQHPRPVAQDHQATASHPAASHTGSAAQPPATAASRTLPWFAPHPGRITSDRSHPTRRRRRTASFDPPRRSRPLTGVQARAARSSSGSPRRSRAHHAQPSWTGTLLPGPSWPASGLPLPRLAKLPERGSTSNRPARPRVRQAPPLELGSVEGLPSAHFRRPVGRRPSVRREAYSSPGGPNDTPPGPRAYTDPGRPSHPGTTRQHRDLGSPAHSPPSRHPRSSWTRHSPRLAPPTAPAEARPAQAAREPVTGQRDHRPG
jgi:hypothetical protein